MKISSIYSSYNLVNQNKKQNNKTSQPKQQYRNSTELRHQFNDYLVTFGARVDKGLNRFFNENKDRMPNSVYNLVEPMKNREILTPLEAQYYAFDKLEDANTVDDIKNAYPKEIEPLFETLKNPQDSNATRGIIKAINEMADIYPDGVLQTKENMTVYLVKKIFLETKTIDEINADLENDLDPDFKVYYQDKNPDSPFVRSSTLTALGIKSPDPEYMQSLRYTRDGYSDMMGAKISKAYLDFINSLTPEQKIAIRKSKVQKFEKWWNSFTRDEKMDLVADKEYQIEMLKKFKQYSRAENKKLKEAGIDIEKLEEERKTPKTLHGEKVSMKLTDDDLFKLWASHNLKLFELSLSQAEQDTFHLKRMVRLVNRWKDMSAAERTDYISKIKSGAEPARFSMIEAWNNSPEIIKALYLHLRENQVYKPADLLYSTAEFSQFQSKVMTEFWQNNPDFAQTLGDNIHKAQLKIELALQRGTFEELKNEINRNKNQRKRELEEYKKSLETPVVQESPKPQEDYKAEFRKAYAQHAFGAVKSVPKNYFADTYELFLDNLPENIIKLWTKNLKGEGLTLEQMSLVENELKEERFPEAIRYNRAFEAAMADSIYHATGNPAAFELSNSDVKFVMYHIERGESPIKILSHKNNNKEYIFNIVNKKQIDPKRINQLYESYKRDLPAEDMTDIIRYNFEFNLNDKDNADTKKAKFDAAKFALCSYIDTYGRSANILFSDKSAYPADVKAAFAKKFFANMPAELRNSDTVRSYIEKDMNMKMESNIGHAKMLYGRRFKFLPNDIVNSYFKELKVMLNQSNGPDFPAEEYLRKICKKRIFASDHGTVAVLPKHLIKDRNIKYQMLAIEQAMADALFEASTDNNAYKICFEHLCDKLELFSMAKSFPVEKSPCPTVDRSSFDIVIKKPINTRTIQKKYKEYMQEISEWKNETKDSSFPDFQELLFILNPDENNVLRDINTAERMAAYFGDLGKLEIDLHH